MYSSVAAGSVQVSCVVNVQSSCSFTKPTVLSLIRKRFLIAGLLAGGRRSVGAGARHNKGTPLMVGQLANPRRGFGGNTGYWSGLTPYEAALSLWKFWSLNQASKSGVGFHSNWASKRFDQPAPGWVGLARFLTKP